MFKTRSLVRSRLPLGVFLVFGMLVLLALLAPDLLAQAAEESAPAASGEAEKQETLWDLIVAGGWAMYPLGLLSVAMITLAVFNSMQLTHAKFIPKRLKESVLANMADVRVRSAIEEAADSPSYLGRMLATALPFVDATEPETLGRGKVEDAIADFSVKENPNFMAWIGYFSVIAQASPMIGLLGTVSGMIKAFQTLGISGGSDPGKLAAAISEALVTTATGLVIAIPCIFCFYFFKNKFNKLVTEAEEIFAEAMDSAIATVNADQHLAKVPEGLSEA